MLRKEKRHLGRGLDYLLGGGAKEEVKFISIDRIKASPFQPRRSFPETGLRELAESIKSKGVIEPIVVRVAADGFYELVCGERRWRASKIAGLKKIPAIVKNVSDDEAFEIALIENIQREDLSPLEFALAFDKLSQRGYTHEEIAKKIGKSRSWITNVMRILNLPAKVRKWIDEGKISLGHAKVLCSVRDKEKVLELAKKVVEEKMSVRELEEIVKKMKNEVDEKLVREVRKKVSEVFPKGKVKVKEKKDTIEIKITVKKNDILH